MATYGRKMPSSVRTEHNQLSLAIVASRWMGNYMWLLRIPQDGIATKIDYVSTGEGEVVLVPYPINIR